MYIIIIICLTIDNIVYNTKTVKFWLFGCRYIFKIMELMDWFKKNAFSFWKTTKFIRDSDKAGPPIKEFKYKHTYFHATRKRRTCIKMLLQMLRMSSRANKNVSEVLLLVIYAGGIIIFALYILLH